MEVTLKTPYKGYTRGRLTGNYNDHKHEVELHGSGKILWLYEDEFDRD